MNAPGISFPFTMHAKPSGSASTDPCPAAEALQTMARKPNYDFEKRRKEQDRKAKKDARREEKRARREQGGAADGAADGDAGAGPDDVTAIDPDAAADGAGADES